MSTGRNLNRSAQDDRDAGKRRKAGKIAVGPRQPPRNPPERPVEIPEQSRLRGPQYPEPLELARQSDAAQAAAASLPVRNLTTKFSTPNPGPNARQERRVGTPGSVRGIRSQNKLPGRNQNSGPRVALGISRAPVFNEDGGRNRARDINNGVNWNNDVGHPTRRFVERPEPYTSGKVLYSPSFASTERQDANGAALEVSPWPKPVMPFKVMARSARKVTARHVPSSANRPSAGPSRRIDVDSSGSELEYVSSSDANVPKEIERPSKVPSNSLLEHVAEVLPPRIYSGRRVPFLRRNLREYFQARYELRIDPRRRRENRLRLQQCPGVTVLYCITDENRSQSHRFEGYISSWICPLCNFLGELRSRGELEFHLERDHGEFVCTWVEEPGFKLRISLPEVPESDSEDEEEDQLDSSSDEDVSEVREFLTSRRQSTPPLLIDDAIEEDVKPFLRGSSVAHTLLQSTPVKPPPPESPSTRAPLSASISKPTRPIRPPDAAHPPIFLPSSSEDAAGRRTAKGKAVVRDRDESPSSEDSPFLTSPHRYPTPPPRTNLEGPSAIYPYLPPDQYSARPGGPKLYDLLNTLSLEPFGLMAWFIVEKEEDIFELDDVRDEDKVMQALWARWILLNRNKFVGNYLLGMKEFIDEYWRMIHRAAGFAALRVWLLVFVSNRFLTGTDFCDLLKYYADLAGMNLWK